MRAWLRRYWWLFLALAFIGATAVLVLELIRPDPVHLAFSRVQLGMTTNECDAVMKETIGHARVDAPFPHVFDGTIGVYAGEVLSVGRAPSSWELAGPEFVLRTYIWDSGQINVLFRTDRVIYKCSARYVPTTWERLLDFVDRARALVHL